MKTTAIKKSNFKLLSLVGICVLSSVILSQEWTTEKASVVSSQPEAPVVKNEQAPAAPATPAAPVTNAKSYSYTVKGKTYQTLKTADNFSAQGTASWYGKPFHNRKTASGETYNMYSMTAANKTLPLSSYVQVTNLNNGKKVIVKINDRGPFVGDRLIDLSYAAAKQLDMVQHGTAQVDIRAVPGPVSQNA